MGAGTMASARIMETWAHGQDIADALGVVRAPTDRLRHVADLGVRTRDHAFRTNSLPVPPGPFRIELARHRGRSGCGVRPGHRVRRRACGGFRASRHPATPPRRPRAGRDRTPCAAVDHDRAGLRRRAGHGSGTSAVADHLETERVAAQRPTGGLYYVVGGGSSGTTAIPISARAGRRRCRRRRWCRRTPRAHRSRPRRSRPSAMVDSPRPRIRRRTTGPAAASCR